MCTTTRLTTVQHVAMCAIMGAMRMTATNVLNVHMNMLPVNLAMDKANFNAVVQLYTLPPSCLLHNMVWGPADELSGSKLPSHPSPLHHLPKLVGLNLDDIETVSPPTGQPHQPFGFQRCIATSWEDTLWEDTALHHSWDSDLLLYTDRSGYKGGIGRATVMLRQGCPPRAAHHIQVQGGRGTTGGASY